MPNQIIVMGVSGSGKSTIGQLLADELGMTFLDADDYHPKANKDKMASGQPLNDQDRSPWLLILKDKLESDQPTVLACSALKAHYRDILDPHSAYHWVYLDGVKELIFARMQARAGHFMKAEMLDSQFETLETPIDAIKVSIEQTPQEIVKEIILKINS